MWLLLVVNVTGGSVSVGVLQGSDLKLRGFPTPRPLLPLFCAFWALLVLMLCTFICSHGMMILRAPSAPSSWLRFGFVACGLSVAWCLTSPVQTCIYSLLLYPLDFAVHSQCPERTGTYVCCYWCEPFFRFRAGKQSKTGSTCRHDLYPSRRLTGEAKCFCLSITFCTIFCRKGLSWQQHFAEVVRHTQTLLDCMWYPDLSSSSGCTQGAPCCPAAPSLWETLTVRERGAESPCSSFEAFFLSLACCVLPALGVSPPKHMLLVSVRCLVLQVPGCCRHCYNAHININIYWLTGWAVQLWELFCLLCGTNRGLVLCQHLDLCFDGLQFIHCCCWQQVMFTAFEKTQ